MNLTKDDQAGVLDTSQEEKTKEAVYDNSDNQLVLAKAEEVKYE